MASCGMTEWTTLHQFGAIYVGPYGPLCRQNYLNTDNLAGRLEMGAMFGVTASTVAINRRVNRITGDHSQIVEASMYVRSAHH